MDSLACLSKFHFHEAWETWPVRKIFLRCMALTHKCTLIHFIKGLYAVTNNVDVWLRNNTQTLWCKVLAILASVVCCLERAIKWSRWTGVWDRALCWDEFRRQEVKETVISAHYDAFCSTHQIGKKKKIQTSRRCCHKVGVWECECVLVFMFMHPSTLSIILCTRARGRLDFLKCLVVV